MQIFNLKINGSDIQWFENQTFEGQVNFILTRSKYSKEQIQKELTDKQITCKVVQIIN